MFYIVNVSLDWPTSLLLFYLIFSFHISDISSCFMFLHLREHSSNFCTEMFRDKLSALLFFWVYSSQPWKTFSLGYNFVESYFLSAHWWYYLNPSGIYCWCWKVSYRSNFYFSMSNLFPMIAFKIYSLPFAFCCLIWVQTSFRLSCLRILGFLYLQISIFHQSWTFSSINTLILPLASFPFPLCSPTGILEYYIYNIFHILAVWAIVWIISSVLCFSSLILSLVLSKLFLNLPIEL